VRIVGLAACLILPSCATLFAAANPLKHASSAQAASAASSGYAEKQCRVDAVKICEEQASNRPKLFFPDAVKGRSAKNPSNLMAFATPFQIPGGSQLKVACYYKPDGMKVVYARAWAVTDEGILVDLDPQPGQVLNSGEPSAPPLDRRSLTYLTSHGYCLRETP
jgi:hypothetical protein